MKKSCNFGTRIRLSLDSAFRLELQSKEDGTERLLWHGYENEKEGPI